jgi:cobalt-zinc-cadmium efflux system outer membrane protein
MKMLITGLFLLVSAQASFAGFLLSLEDAERLVLENNIELKAKRAELRKSEAEVIGARLLPNPEARYFLAAVGSGPGGRESTASVVQPIDITGKRAKRIETAEKRRDAQRFFFDYESFLTIVRVKQLYYRILLLKENEKAILDILDTAEEVEKRTASRVEVGDVSEAELMKLGTEKKKFQRMLEGLGTDLEVERKKLALILNLSDTGFDLSQKFQYEPVMLPSGQANEKIYEKRHDIKAQNATVEAASSSLALAKREIMSNVGVEAGYRKWVDGQDGFVFGLVLPLPLFDRNQGRIASAQAEIDKQRFNYELLKKQATYEIRVLEDRVRYYQGRIEGLAGQIKTTRELTSISRISYEEGEASLIELLEAVRAERDLIMEYNSSVYEYWSSVFELERATHTRLTNPGEKS